MTFQEDLRRLRRQRTRQFVLTLLVAAAGFAMPLLLLTGDVRAVLPATALLTVLYLPITAMVVARAKLDVAEAVPPRREWRQDRILLHVVHEITLAAGLPRPPRVLIARDLASINAFVVGTRKRATIVVSRPAVDRLTREELTGVIGHEMAHILHGDLQLIALAEGATATLQLWLRLLKVAAVAVLALATFRWLARRREDRRGAGAFEAVVGLVILGFLIACGWLALLATRLSVARLRRTIEFQADARAVQLTRNPRGLASALLRCQTDWSAPRAPHGRRRRHDPDVTRAFDEHPPTSVRVRRLLGRHAVQWPHARNGGRAWT